MIHIRCQMIGYNRQLCSFFLSLSIADDAPPISDLSCADGGVTGLSCCVSERLIIMCVLWCVRFTLVLFSLFAVGRVFVVFRSAFSSAAVRVLLRRVFCIRRRESPLKMCHRLLRLVLVSVICFCFQKSCQFS